MLIYFALLTYAVAPIAAFFLIQRKKDEGQIWLLFLTCSVIGSILIFLSPIILEQGDHPYLWFSTTSMTVSIGLQWEKSDWVLQQFIALFIVIYMVKNYMAREQQALPFREICFLFCSGILGISALIIHKEFAMAAFLFCLDGLRLILRFAKDHEIFSNRRETLSLLLRFISIILLILLATMVDTERNDLNFLFQFTLMAGVIFLRLGAEFIDQISPSRRSYGINKWIIFLESVIIIRMMTMLPIITNKAEGTSLYLLLLCGILFLSFFYLWIWRSNHEWNGFISSATAFFLAVYFFLLGVRQELLFLVLSIYFLLLNDQVASDKKATRIILIICEEIFLLGYTFSPNYALNKALLNAQNTTPFVFFAFLMEGIYSAGFAIIQKKAIRQPVSEIKKDSFFHNLLLWLSLAGLLLIVIKGFVPMDGFEQISWFAFTPLILLILIPLDSFVNRRKNPKGIQDETRLSTPSSRIVEKITHIFLIIVNVFRQFFEGISALLEREGGLVWAIIILILLLTLFKGLSQA
ncbi:MAG: hypothetical protein C4545_09000 [Anaerolineaceae bacterium]|nr:MAG: hypothetical protein C4545_09000 [Anaerolineaceae bacterium]